MNRAPAEIDLATIHKLLSETSRRRIIHHVATQDTEVLLTGERIAETIATNQGGDPDEWYAKLRHRHLPSMTCHGAIDWNEDTDCVKKSEYTMLLFEYLSEVEGGC